MKKLLYCFLFAAIIPLLLLGSAAADPEIHQYKIPFYVNPIYADIFTAEELQERWTPEQSTAEFVGKDGEQEALTKQEVVLRLRSGLSNFDSVIYIPFHTPELYDNCTDLFDEARAHTGVPNEGDYINYNFAGYGGNISYRNMGTYYEGYYQFEVQYLHSQTQEADATAAFQAAYDEIQPQDQSDYEITKAVYDYLIDKLVYDHEHLEDNTYTLKHSSYSAIVQHYTVCQGYASSMYRLLLMFNVNNRVASSVTHAWNLVSVNGDWYQVDTTWGDTEDGPDYTYFLKSKNAWIDEDHVFSTLSGRVDPNFIEYDLLSNQDYSPKSLTQSISIMQDGTEVNFGSVTIHTAEYQFTAAASPLEAGQDLVWTSDDTNTAAVDKTGKVTFLKYGTVRLTVTPRDGSDAYAYFSVTYTPLAASVSIYDLDSNVINGRSISSSLNPYQFSASVSPAEASQNLEWSTNDDSIAEADSTGKLSFRNLGSVRVTVSTTDGSGTSGFFDFTLLPETTSITIKDPNGNAINGKSITSITSPYQVSASVSPSGASQALRWNTSDTSIAEVDSTGKITFKKTGTVTVTVNATDGSGKSAYFKLTLLPPATSITIRNAQGNTVNGISMTSVKNPYQFSASVSPAGASQKLNWSTSDTSIAEADSSGKVTFKKTGTVKITVSTTDGSGISANFTFTLMPATTSITIRNAQGNTVNDTTVTSSKKTDQYSASAAPSGASQVFTWTTSDTSIATVDSTGKVTFKKAGTVQITVKATDETGISANFKYKYVPLATSVKIKNPNGKAVNGKTITVTNSPYKLSAAALPAGAAQTFKWTSSNKKIATVSSAGKVTFKKVGKVKITVKAADGSGKSAYVNLTYKPKTASITIKNAKGTVVNGKTLTVRKKAVQFKATAKPVGVPQVFTWTSSNKAIATVDSTGKVTFKKAGTVKITAKATDGTKVKAYFKLTYKP